MKNFFPLTIRQNGSRLEIVERVESAEAYCLSQENRRLALSKHLQAALQNPDPQLNPVPVAATLEGYYYLPGEIDPQVYVVGYLDSETVRALVTQVNVEHPLERYLSKTYPLE